MWESVIGWSPIKHCTAVCLWECMCKTVAVTFGLVVSIEFSNHVPIVTKTVIFYGLFGIQPQDMFYSCSLSGSDKHWIQALPFIINGTRSSMLMKLSMLGHTFTLSAWTKTDHLFPSHNSLFVQQLAILLIFSLSSARSALI
jgi:hypothetical protein